MSLSGRLRKLDNPASGGSVGASDVRSKNMKFASMRSASHGTTAPLVASLTLRRTESKMSLSDMPPSRIISTRACA